MCTSKIEDLARERFKVRRGADINSVHELRWIYQSKPEAALE
jgi:hypothetical protein